MLVLTQSNNMDMVLKDITKGNIQRLSINLMKHVLKFNEFRIVGDIKFVNQINRLTGVSLDLLSSNLLKDKVEFDKNDYFIVLTGEEMFYRISEKSEFLVNWK